MPSHRPVVSIVIIAVSVGVFLLAQVSPEFGRLTFTGGAQQQDLVREGQSWRLLTAAFLHAGLTHLLFNMWALYVLGIELERRIGGLPYAALYLASALSGGVAYQLVGGSAPVVGASGAIFGLFGSWLVVAWRARGSAAGRAGLSQMLTLLAVNLALPLFIPGIAWQAHLGGFAAGCLITAVWTVRPLRSAVARAGIAAAVALLAFAVGTA
jgi:membrane associated rhomboid family serine protease